MLLQQLLSLALSHALLAAAEPVVLAHDGGVVRAARELPNSPSGQYKPAVVDCPSPRPSVRPAGGLSAEERAWLSVRRNLTVAPMIDLLTRGNISGFDAQAYITKAATGADISALPNVAIAVSGGGYRALLNGAGFIAAADNRTAGTLQPGGIGGLLQASTYLAGLSGGGWLVSSLFSNNFTTVEALRDGVWKFDSNILQGPQQGGVGIFNTADYWNDIYDQVRGKSGAGFETTITDYWGRALSYQLINATDGGPNYTFSSIALTPGFAQGGTPFPILVADERGPGQTIVSLNATNFEFNPFEMGSFDPTTYGFVPTRYLGSNFSGGVVPANGSCVGGFDQSGYVLGTTSTLFNQFLLTNISSIADVPKVVISAIEGVLTALSEGEEDIALYEPNPFLQWNTATNPAANDSQLTLVDGGEDLQNIPLTPLVQPVRAVDVIFAVDSSADTLQFWPNGTALRASYDRSHGAIANGTLFPPVPDANTFINQGLNNRPAFFGCDVANFTLAPGQVVPPLLVYVPNAPYTAMTNVSTFDPTYPDAQRDDMIKNGLNAATQGNGTLDSAWPTCVACAVLSRSLARTNTTVPAACQACFARYCWNGTLDQADNGPYYPTFKIANETTITSGAAGVAVVGGSAGLMLAAVVAVAGAVLVM